MPIHSQILVHWTGHDIEDRAKHDPRADRAQLYVARLTDDLEHGLYTRRTNEPTTRYHQVKRLARICFTEIRLSQAQTHAERYGSLGIGFERDFILDRGGRPVIYIPYEAEPTSCLLENSISSLNEGLRDLEGYEDLRKAAQWVSAYVKRMWDEEGRDYFDEMEWRIVHDENPDNVHFERESSDVFRLKFNAGDVKVIVLPDEATRQLALRDEYIRTRFANHTPIMATLHECLDF